MSNHIEVVEANYVVLTAEQFAEDYPSDVVALPDGATREDRVLVLYDDCDEMVVAIWGGSNDLSTFSADLAKYVASNANPGVVEAKVGRNITVIGK